jgi:hypothetical protein
MPSAITGSTGHPPGHAATTARTARTAAACAAHIRFWVPSPAVAPESSRWPRRRLTLPSTGMMTTLDAVSTIPKTDAAAGWCPARSRTAATTMYGARIQKLTATARCARRSTVSDRVRDPVNRQITITLASASIALPSAHPTSATDPAARPATRPATPSAVIHASDAQASQRAYRAARYQRSSRLTGGAAVQSSQQAAGATTCIPPRPASGGTDIRPTLPYRPRERAGPLARAPSSQTDRNRRARNGTGTGTGLTLLCPVFFVAAGPW